MAKKRDKKRKKDLEKRLAGYSLAAGALLGMGASASAEVVRTDVNRTIDIGSSFDINFDAAGDTADIRLVVDGSVYTSYTTSTVMNTNTFTNTFTNTHTNTHSNQHMHFISTTFGMPMTTTTTTHSTTQSTTQSTSQYTTQTTSMFTNPAGTFVSSVSMRAERLKEDVSFVGSGTTSNNYAYPYALRSSQGVSAAGPWAAASTNQLDYSYGSQGNWDGKTGFMGVKFKISGQDHYGWVRMRCNGNSLTVFEYAYETTPGVGIPSIAASLPVTLAGFNAVAGDAGVVLSWATETEENNLGFIIERKTVDGAWTEIASFSTHDDLRGSGTAAYRNEYAFTDTDADAAGTYHYRLKDVDTAGKETVLGVVTSAPDETSGITLSPVSAAGGIQGARYGLAADAQVNLTVMDIMGRNIRQLADAFQPAGSYTVYWDGKDAHGRKAGAGTYLLVLRSGDTVVTQKLRYLGR